MQRKNDRLHLLRMREAAQYAIRIVQGRERRDLDEDLTLQLALVKAVELVGETANRVSVELRNQENQLPWRRIIGMRHILVHHYWRLDLDIVWEAAMVDIPPLITELEAILARMDDL